MATVALDQGMLFMKQQSKIKSNNKKRIKRHALVEGFTNNTPIIDGSVPAEQSNKVLQTTEITEPDQTAINKLRAQVTTANQQVLDAQAKYDYAINSYNKRVSSTNPYLDKNVSFADGTTGYVTHRGVFEKYDDISNTAGKNNCPSASTITQVPFTFTNISQHADVLWPSNSNKPANTSCGNEGSNVYVSTMLNKVGVSYLGAYYDNTTNPAMSFVDGAPTQQVNAVIQNGTFSNPGIQANSYQYINSNTQVPGWNFNAVLVNNSSAWGYPMPYPSGPQCVSIQMTGSISQSITFGAGAYTLTFSACGRNCCDGSGQSNPINILLNNSVIYKANASINNWTSFTVPFTVATAGSSVLTFQGTWNQGDRSTAVQNISLSTSGTNAGGKYNYDTCKQSAIDGGYKYFGLENNGTNGAFCSVGNNLQSATQYGQFFSPCVQGSDGKTYANTGSNAIYKTDGTYLGCYKDNQTNPAMTVSGPNMANYQKVYVLGQFGCSPWGGSAFPDPTANWIWYTPNAQQNAPVNAGNPVTFLYQFTMPGTNYTNVTISAMCDDRSQVYLNGNLVGAVNGGWGSPGTQFSAVLNPGSNWVMASVENTGGPAGFLLSIYSQNNFFWSPGSKTILCNTNSAWGYTNTPISQLTPSGQNTVASCQSYAKTNGFQYFGLQGGTQSPICSVSNNLATATQYGNTAGTTTVNGKNYGLASVNAIYQVDAVGISNNLGKMGHVNDSGVLSEYPNNMIGGGSVFQQSYSNINSLGNDLPNQPMTNSNLSSCQTACINNADCYGVVFDTNENTCWMKNKNAIKSQRKYSKGVNLYLRDATLVGANNSCNTPTKYIDTVTWANYQNSQQQMSSASVCGNTEFANESQILGLRQDLEAKQANLAKLQEQLNNSTIGLQKDSKISNHQQSVVNTNTNVTNAAIDTTIKTSSIPIAVCPTTGPCKNDNGRVIPAQEGFTSYFTEDPFLQDKTVNFKNINSLVQDSNSVVLQENYRFIFWSIIAIATTIVFVKVAK